MLGLFVGADAKTQFEFLIVFSIATAIPIVCLIVSIITLKFIDGDNNVHLWTTPLFVVVLIFAVVSPIRMALLVMMLYPFRLLWNAL
jgi:hypothetical protein